MGRGISRWIGRLGAACSVAAAGTAPLALAQMAMSTGASAAAPVAAARSVDTHSQSALDGHSYSLLTSRGDLLGMGASLNAVASPPTSPVVALAATPDGRGAWTAEANGDIHTYGDAAPLGSMAGHSLYRPVVAMAATPTGGGYWEVASDGGIFTFGNAQYYGSMGGTRLAQPVVGMAATPTGGGYWEVASDGGIFTFGNAPFYGSAARWGRAVVGMAVEVGGYENPLRAISNLTPERIDQGVDYAGSGPIYAIGDGVVMNTTNPGWPGGAFIAYQLSDGPASGDIVYVAETVVPKVQVGQQVTPSTVVGTLVDSYPDLEIGWAEPPGDGESAAYAAGQWSTVADAHSLPTAFGLNFSQLLTVLGCPAGVNGGAVQGSLPPGWPSW